MNENRNTLQLVIFDIAGTTVKDHGFVERAFLSVSQQHNLGLDGAWVKPRMGVHKLQVMREAIEQSTQTISATAEQLAQAFEDAIDREVESGAAPAIEGARELIEELRDSGVKVAFTTGFSRKTALTVLKGAGLEGDALVASDEVTKGRPEPEIVHEAMRRTGVEDPGTVAVIGDTPSDLGSGTNAKAALVIGIGHGTHELTELADYPHTDLAANTAALRTLLSKHVDLPVGESR